jgi:hypothetical protein
MSVDSTIGVVAEAPVVDEVAAVEEVPVCPL